MPLNSPRRTRAKLKSEKAEHVSDKLLDGAAGLANRVTGGKFADRVESSREAADKQIGNE